jgi:hypothetical protein
MFLISPTLNTKAKKTSGYVFDKDSDWVDVTIWATENCVDYWLNGKRVNVYVFSSSKKNNNIYIKFPPNIKIDNISIKTINKSECTDISQFKKLNEELTKDPKTSLTQIVAPLDTYFPQNKLPNFNPVYVVFDSCSEEENALYFLTEKAKRNLR